MKAAIRQGIKLQTKIGCKMFVEFNTYHGSRMAVRPEQVTYIMVSDETTTWIVFGPNDFEVRVKHPYKYVMEQLSKSKQEEQPCAPNLV